MDRNFLLSSSAVEGHGMREFVVDLTDVTTVDGFVTAFNTGFCQHVGGKVHRLNWDAFNDYLSWPEEERYRLTFRSWKRIKGVQRSIANEIFRDNPHVEVVFA
jgi:hypothetical protein